MRHALNLIDAKLLPQPVRPPIPVLLSTLALALSGLLGHFAWERSQFAATLARPGAAEALSEVEQPPDPAFEERLRQVQRDEALRDALAGVTDLPRDSAVRLRALARALPDALWLTEVELSGRSGLRIAGGALDPSSLAAYVARLGQIDGLRGLPLKVASVEPLLPQASDAEAAETPSKPLERDVRYQFVLASVEPQGASEGPR